MLNYSIRKKSVVAIALVSVLALGTEPGIASDITGNVRFHIGQKSLESEDWSSMDQQDAFGVIFDIGRKEWPVAIAIDFFGSARDSDRDEFNRKRGYSAEHHFGVRKIWSGTSSFNPYIGGGLALIQAGFEQQTREGVVKDDDSALGGWLGGGAYWRASQSVTLGFDVRYSQADVTVLDQEIKAGGVQAGVSVGYHW